ncbi:DNA-processing protein DprA [Falsibacillus albus]|uniref:DNA-protecting protein DprA n=1 Tax=Falsibacillus albus TaxID=2478915 RepID=A0A3L7JY82_9BACI|nr:DNA-processing protein DprA [Falsibacillus albus]RLQ95757.1 DNA-protecting protein DprA [Falsibacillus albus]
MNEILFELIKIHHSASLTIQQFVRLMKADPHLTSYQSWNASTWQKNLHLPLKKTLQIIENLNRIPFKRLFHTYEERQIRYISILDPDYPPHLKNIYNPPWILYTLGNANLLNSKQIAVVGSRRPLMTSQYALKKILPDLLADGFTITSGLAKGIDAEAHKMAISLGGKTIGVLGSGFFEIYPQENRGLAENMKINQLLISEYPPYQRPNRWHFPMRNRIISGLALGTLVIQASKKSGSLITAELSSEEGRDVFVVPGPIHFPQYEGSNLLIQDGAKLVQNGREIMEELNHFLVERPIKNN